MRESAAAAFASTTHSSASAALAGHRKHASADGDVPDVGRDFRHHAGDFVSRRERWFGLALVFARDHQRVRKSEADGVDAQADAAGLQRRRRDIAHAELRRRTEAVEDECAHADHGKDRVAHAQHIIRSIPQCETESLAARSRQPETKNPRQFPAGGFYLLRRYRDRIRRRCRSRHDSAMHRPRPASRSSSIAPPPPPPLPPPASAPVAGCGSCGRTTERRRRLHRWSGWSSPSSNTAPKSCGARRPSDH